MQEGLDGLGAALNLAYPFRAIVIIFASSGQRLELGQNPQTPRLSMSHVAFALFLSSDSSFTSFPGSHIPQ